MGCARLIASDLISRGIDLPSVSHVISYDIPSDMRKYVHRVGRTARAGKEGEAWSLVEDQEAAAFKGIMKGAQHWEKIGRVRVKDTLVEGFVPSYQVRCDLPLLNCTDDEADRAGSFVGASGEQEPRVVVLESSVTIPVHRLLTSKRCRTSAALGVSWRP